MHVQRSRRPGEGSLPWIAALGHPLNREPLPGSGRLSPSSGQRLYSPRSLTYGKLAGYCIATSLPATDFNIDIRQTAASMSLLPYTRAHSVTGEEWLANADPGLGVGVGSRHHAVPAFYLKRIATSSPDAFLRYSPPCRTRTLIASYVVCEGPEHSPSSVTPRPCSGSTMAPSPSGAACEQRCPPTTVAAGPATSY